MRSTGRRRGLRKLSSDFIGKAADETATQVTRIGLTFLGTTVFCLLSLLSPDSALLGGSERINVPFAGPVSFFGFMLLGPMVLIVLRVYLQIYVEHGERWDRLARSMSIMRAPALGPLQHPLIRYFSGLIFYLLLPVTMLLFAWKAAVFPAWGSGLLCLAVAVIASHLILPLKKFSWLSKALLSAGAALVVLAMIVGSGTVRRPFALFRANLSGQWLARQDLRGANLFDTNLSRADLFDADLSRADLFGANLSSADLTDANLSGANLIQVNLSSANLGGANLSGANLIRVNLSDAKLFDANLSGATLILANLFDANLSRADLSGADLTGDDLTGANLARVNLSSANLVGANLTDAKLFDANLSGANLITARNLSQQQLDKACGNADTKLPSGFTLKACPQQ
jgi:uncharacterized protein YjbI with pentapeptide repeats